MQGTIKTYLPEKGYGFIKGDDGKDYFFHIREFHNKTHAERVCEAAIVQFEQQATPKGYKAKRCILLNPKDIFTYITPDHFLTSKTDSVRGWEIIERGNWIVHGNSDDSPEAAKQKVIDRAKSVGANAIIELKYYKTTGSSDNYRFTIHNFQGRVVTLAKKNSMSKYSVDDLVGLNQQAEVLEQRLIELARKAMKERMTIFLVAIVALFTLFGGIKGLLTIIPAFLFFKWVNKYSKEYDIWLERG